MKRGITSLLLLLALVTTSVFAQYTTDGMYTIRNVHVDRNNYLASDGSTDALAVVDYNTDVNAVLRIVANGTKYNILSNDGAYVLGSKVFVLSSVANLNAATSLVEILPFNGNFLLRYNNGTTNHNLKSATDVGAGDYTMDNYQWIITRVGDLPASGVPIATVTQPTGGATIAPSASVTLTATATVEDATISSVEFLVDDVKVGDGVLNVDVYEYTWTAPATTGAYAITAKATSSTAAIDTSNAVNITVAVLPATVTLTSPVTAGSVAEINSTFTLTAEAEATTGQSITKVEFYEGANLLGEGTLDGGVYEFDWTPTVAATYSITAKVTDDAPSSVTSSAADLEVKTAMVKALHLGFEDGLTTSWDASAGTLTNEGTMPRTGSKSLVLNSSGVSNVVESENAIDANAGDPICIIAWIAADNAAAVSSIPVFYAPDNVVKTTPWTPGRVAISADNTYQRITESRVALETATEYFAYIRSQHTATANEYIDDIVIYTHSAGLDLVVPESADGFTFISGAGDSKDLSWTNGSDAKTYIDKTIILRTSNTSAAAPELMAQAAYEAGDAIGDWTVLALVDTTDLAYNDATAVSATDYQYAVVHKDLAYNYSAAVVDDGVVTGLNKVALTSFNCVGTTGAIQMSTLPLGENVEVYSISGMKVFAKTVTSSQLTVDLSQGIYMVRVADEVQKVVVR